MASDEERLAGKSFDALEPYELAQLYRLMTRLRARDAAAAHAPPREGAPRPAHRPAPHAARQPAHRRRPDPPRAPPPPRRPPPARDAVRHLGLDGALRARLPAVPDLRRRQRAERRGVRVRHAADAPDPRAGLAPPRARDPARRRGGAGLVERHPDRRRAEDVQRPPRPARHGPRRGGRDPLRRLGARRPDARRPRDGAPGAARAPDRVGQPARRAPSAFSVQAGGMVAALPHCDALVSGHSFEALGEVVAAIGGGDAGAPAPAARRPPAGEDEPEPWASATPVAGSSVAMPSGHGPSKGNTTPGWVTDDDGVRPASTPAASARRCRRIRWAARSRPSATSRSTTR